MKKAFTMILVTVFMVIFLGSVVMAEIGGTYVKPESMLEDVRYEDGVSQTKPLSYSTPNPGSVTSAPVGAKLRPTSKPAYKFSTPEPDCGFSAPIGARLSTPNPGSEASALEGERLCPTPNPGSEASALEGERLCPTPNPGSEASALKGERLQQDSSKSIGGSYTKPSMLEEECQYGFSNEKPSHLI